MCESLRPDMKSNNSVHLPEQLLGDARLLALLFVSFRLALFMAFQPLLIDGFESGIGAGGDRLFHFRLAALSEGGMIPFRDWWSEFPPIWYAITTAVHELLGDRVNYTNWSFLLGMLMLGCELGNLTLVRAIGQEVYDKQAGMHLAWVYSVSPAPVIFMWWNFESLLTFTMLLGILLLLRNRLTASALVVGFGILVKFVPALIIGAVIRYRGWAQSAKYVTLAFAVAALVYLPLFVSNAEFTAISLRAQWEKPSSQTIWALFDGNTATGNIANVKSRLSPETADSQDDASPARISNWLRLILAAVLGLIIYVRTHRRDGRGALAFVGIAVLVFYLQAQAWSPQWVCTIIPLMLLIFPTRRGVFATVVLTLVVLAEYPLLWSRTADLDPAGVMAGDLLLPWMVLVLLRTGMLAGLAIACYKALRVKASADAASS